uniref:DUF916 domain-containing protein n=1 Tax=Parastrongyloides trichosuri TaxID=131310 RepID=A0A0N4Z739_PARTI
MKVSLYRRNNVWWLLLSLIINTSYCSHYFQVSISIVSKSKICYGDCVIPYKLVVSKEINDLKELNEEMMVFGEFEVINNTNNEGYLNEITVVRMPKSLRESKEPVHIELTILDLPSNIEGM